MNIPTVVGHGGDRELLERLGVRRALALAAVGSDDLDNIAVSVAAQALSPGLRLVLRAGEQEAIAETRSLLRLGIIRDVTSLSATYVVAKLIGLQPQGRGQRQPPLPGGADGGIARTRVHRAARVAADELPAPCHCLTASASAQSRRFARVHDLRSSGMDCKSGTRRLPSVGRAARFVAREISAEWSAVGSSRTGAGGDDDGTQLRKYDRVRRRESQWSNDNYRALTVDHSLRTVHLRRDSAMGMSPDGPLGLRWSASSVDGQLSGRAVRVPLSEPDYRD